MVYSFSLQMRILKCHSQTVNQSLMSLVTCPVYHGTSVWGMASYLLCPPRDAQLPWQPSSGLSVLAGTPQPVWIQSHWNGTMTMT